MLPFTIIVPCYNESNRLQIEKFISFANTHQDVYFIFVNDGSTDTTDEILKTISNIINACVISLSENSGKGEAVRQGFLKALTGLNSFIGFLDADLSTSLEEFYVLKQIAEQQESDVLIASRVKKLDSTIIRSGIRHFIGRTMATIIDKHFHLGVYDTQCGAKIFKPEILSDVIINSFKTRWFFDVELLLRIRNKYPSYKALEVPLKNWENVKDSKINLLHAPEVLKELWLLLRNY